MNKTLSHAINSDAIFAKSISLGGKLAVKLAPYNVTQISLSIVNVNKEDIPGSCYQMRWDHNLSLC